jgi:hypothetical protein
MRPALRTPLRQRWVLIVAGLLLVAFAASADASDADPRAAEIKRRLERFGLKVTEVSYAPAKAPSAAVWAAGTVAQYDKPSWDKVTDQALTVWNVMFSVLKGEAASTLFVAPQDWTTYRLLIASTQGKIADFDKATRTVQTDADRTKAFQALLGSIVFRVYDLQQKKMIDDKVFVKEHFAK